MHNIKQHEENYNITLSHRQLDGKPLTQPLENAME